jgi:hypothetical protein
LPAARQFGGHVFQRLRHSAVSAPQALAYASVTSRVGRVIPLAAVDSTDGANSALLASAR